MLASRHTLPFAISTWTATANDCVQSKMEKNAGNRMNIFRNFRPINYTRSYMFVNVQRGRLQRWSDAEQSDGDTQRCRVLAAAGQAAQLV